MENGRIYRPDKGMTELPWTRSPKGSPGVTIQDFLTISENDALTVRHVKVETGGRIVPHAHDVWEVFYLLEGDGEATMGARTEFCSKGTCLVAPPGVRHSLKNTGEVSILLLCIFTPPLSA